MRLFSLAIPLQRADSESGSPREGAVRRGTLELETPASKGPNCGPFLGGGLSLRDQGAAEGLAYRFRLGVDVQLLVDAADVGADGVDAQLELFGCALVAVALGQQLQQPDFVGSERLVDLLGRTGLLKQCDHFAGDFRRERRTPRARFGDRFQQSGRGRLLQQIPAGTVVYRLKNLVLLSINCQHQDLDRRVFFLQQLNSVGTRHTGEVDVQ